MLLIQCYGRYVMSDMFAGGVLCDVRDAHLESGPLIGAPPRSLPADGKPALLVWQLALSYHRGRTYLRMLRVNHGCMWNVKCDVLRCM